MRINILYLLDSLCEASVHYQQATPVIGSSGAGSSRKPTSYVEYVSRDLDQIVQLVVPDNRDGLVNLASARQVRQRISQLFTGSRVKLKRGASFISRLVK